MEKRKLAKGRGTADPSCFRPIGDLRVLRRLLRRGRRRARPWHGAAVPPRPLPPPRRLQGHEAAARDTGSRLPFEPRMQPIGPSQPADDLVADLACSRTALSQESFWQIGFDDTVTNSMVEMSHQGLTKAFARGCRPFKPLTAPQMRPARLPRAALCLRCKRIAAAFVCVVRTYATGPNSPLPLSCMAS